ncbi:bifunctional dTDP-4-dehydrorhamnose 3,5-epimerase/dTDP-4-dehydrorhamnose reductase-like [Lingula anatina]|uniref:Bifunctional dTDP-4-dehydrorhamnose 3,5-epimerase/dTDP-4-dehydrorhamnose reductase-like n=1 Tax=Lingula anatina TaxID=7574 RepID=A0A1S3IQX8_LINAN|nr:bifunctional dTDP-4-dehydrorhamnose 3,5-epimerase/dTDP-4-dehydrorhamnose reductase-like [Lingula anatina]|eukprot:XP_013399954.1 bifunctional dTDP-4-dehydrorhamnose 3,5-epimerase/dTDP-4-dehydrorhamnose reductase-like [Lingula anatina]
MPATVKVHLFGKTGWIGSQLLRLMVEKPYEVTCSDSRMEEREQVERELDAVQPKYVIIAAGLTGRPNVDWCDSNQQETIRANVIGLLTVVDLCATRGIHVTYFGTGCIYEYDENHPIGGRGFTEEDAPNFTGSFYSKTKGMVER